MTVDLSVYVGEFLVSPIPLELSLNYCSHKCAYCFANLNKPDRKADVKALYRYFSAYKEKEDLKSRLLKQGYPVLFSNKVDPFAGSNYQQALPIIEVMLSMGIPIAWQTKGGKGVDQILKDLPRACWYISLSFLDDDLRKKIEPGAPSVSERLKLIESLINAGHHVSLGMNPLVPEWLPRPEKLLDKVYSIGVRDVWAEHLHLNYKQIRQMSEREKENIGGDLIKRAQKHRIDQNTYDLIRYTAKYAEDKGMNFFAVGYPYKSGYWDAYYKTYDKLFPIHQEFVNHGEDLEGGFLTFDDYANECIKALPSGKYKLDHYIATNAHNILQEYRFHNQMEYRDLLRIIWNDPRAKQSLLNTMCFEPAIDEDGKYYFDKNDNIVIKYTNNFN